MKEIVMLSVILILSILCGALGYKCWKKDRMLNYVIQEKKNKAGKRVALWDEEENEKLQLVKKRVELYTLQSQINPHFLYNTLDCIRSKALLDGQKEIASMTEILSKFFRYCISNDESLVKIREELNHINDYYYIQKYRFEDRFDMEVFIEDEEVLDYYIPKMTLQPLVENAMIHGLEKVNRKGHLELRVNVAGNKIIIKVSDDGVGMSVEQLDKLNERMNQMLFSGSKKGTHNSIAITNVNTRIKITFGEEYGIHYRSMENLGTDAIVRIPKIDDFSRIKYEREVD